MIYKSKFSIHFLIITVLIIIGCSESVLIDEKKVFRYNEHSNISSLDPVYSSTLRNIWPVNQIFNGLVQLDDSLKVKPDLAKNWIISKNGLEYKFLIKKHIFYHHSKTFGRDSTRAVNASDFEYSFKRLNDPQLGSPGSWALKNVSSFKAENDSVFVIKLKKPFAAFLGLLSMKYFSVVPFEAVNYYGDKFGKNPIGTGPFKFKRWEENIKLVLRKNYLYFEKDRKGKNLPYLEAISITFLPDKKSEFMEFLSGNFDFISSPENTIIDQIFDIKYCPCVNQDKIIVQ